MAEACAETVVVVPAAGTTACSDAQPHAEPSDPDYPRKVFRAAAACGACVRLAVLATVAYAFVHTVRFASHEPRREAFFAGAHAVVTTLVVCLRRRCAARSRRLKPKPDSSSSSSSSNDGRWGWWVRLAEDVATDFLFWVFGFRVAEVGPPALTVLVLCVMVVISCVVVYKAYHDDDLIDQQHQYDQLALGDDDADDAGDTNRDENGAERSG